jgi:hypothetical protein
VAPIDESKIGPAHSDGQRLNKSPIAGGWRNGDPLPLEHPSSDQGEGSCFQGVHATGSIGKKAVIRASANDRRTSTVVHPVEAVACDPGPLGLILVTHILSDAGLARLIRGTARAAQLPSGLEKIKVPVARRMECARLVV